MSKELLELINKLDIRVYSTTSGRQLIGEVSFEEDMKVTLNCPLEFVQKLATDTLSMNTVLVPPVINNTGPIKLYPQAIESETVADIRLKKLYCDQLTCNKLALIEEGQPKGGYLTSVIDAWKKKS